MFGVAEPLLRRGVESLLWWPMLTKEGMGQINSLVWIGSALLLQQATWSVAEFYFREDGSSTAVRLKFGTDQTHEPKSQTTIIVQIKWLECYLEQVLWNWYSKPLVLDCIPIIRIQLYQKSAG